ncbi:MAG: hypothetical protein MRY83_05515 [Flavobacteriales bacterium]|nr:hypothetical protein [Flavobacteriales bacterium]
MKDKKFKSALSVLAGIGFIFLAFGSSDGTPEEKLKELEEAQQHQSSIKQNYEYLTKALEKMDQINTPGSGVKSDEGDWDKLKDIKYVKDEYVPVPIVYFPYLKKYKSLSPSDWEMNDPFEWINSAIFNSKECLICNEYDTTTLKYTVQSKIEERKKAFDLLIKRKYIYAIVPFKNSKNTMPVYTSDTEVSAGYFNGWLALIDLEKTKVYYMKDLEVRSSEEISVFKSDRGITQIFNEELSSELIDDFQDNFEDAIEEEGTDFLRLSPDNGRWGDIL